MNKKFLFSLISIMAIVSMLLAACAPAATPTEAPPAVTEAPPAVVEAPKFKACQVTDTGGIDDKSFNATAWKGIQDAIERARRRRQVSRIAAADRLREEHQRLHRRGLRYHRHRRLLVGRRHPGRELRPTPMQKFSIVDYAYDPTIPNVLGQVFATDQAAFLAGYVAAGVSKTGKVGTFGGIQIPPVTVFMDGFVLGARLLQRAEGHRTSKCWVGIRSPRPVCSPATSRAPMTVAPWARP